MAEVFKLAEVVRSRGAQPCAPIERALERVYKRDDLPFVSSLARRRYRGG